MDVVAVEATPAEAAMMPGNRGSFRWADAVADSEPLLETRAASVALNDD